MSMSTLELEIKKEKLIKYIQEADDEVVIDIMIEDYDYFANTPYPCNYSKEEIMQSCIEAIEAFKRGEMDKFTPHEEIKKKYLKQSPCSRSDEEMLQRFQDAIEAAERGELIPHEQIKRKPEII